MEEPNWENKDRSIPNPNLTKAERNYIKPHETINKYKKNK